MRKAKFNKKQAVLLIGHGAPATDCPPQLIGELMGLHFHGEGHGNGHSSEAIDQRAKQLDAQIRDWPRTEKNDPYKIGLEKVAAALRPLLSAELFAIGYNEFCRPSTEEAAESIIAEGAEQVLVIPSMLTPGGLHSEIDIPRSIEKLQKLFPEVEFRYVWPFEVKAVAELLNRHLEAEASRSGGAFTFKLASEDLA